MTRHAPLLLLAALLLAAGCSDDGDDSATGRSPITSIDKANALPPSALTGADANSADLGIEGFDGLNSIISEVLTVPETSGASKRLGKLGPRATMTESIDVSFDIDGNSGDDVAMTGTISATTNDNGNGSATWTATATTLTAITDTDEDGVTYTIAAGASFAISGSFTIVATETSSTLEADFVVEYSNISASWLDGTESGDISYRGRTVATMSGTESETESELTMSITHEAIATITVGAISTTVESLMEGTISFADLSEDANEPQVWIAIDGTSYGPFTEAELDALDGGATAPAG